MDKLWAPWRMQFIREARCGSSKDACVFCSVRDQQDDRAALILKRGRHAYVVLNKFPYNNGHLMVVPNRHVAELHELTTEEHTEMMQLLASSVTILRDKINAEGINCGINLGKVAGAGILDHVHIHAVPRWTGDNNFLPIFADTRVLPEYIDETYLKLVGGFQ
ncbi:MAG: HIT domain-containing protein [Deltaproteobacteria bacterium]|nr:HIT domain-containing protein [Deltaproteobacteria bacterium]